MMASEPPPPLPSAEDLKAIREIRDEDLPWLPPVPEVDNRSRFITKAKENPFVPLGWLCVRGVCVCVCVCVCVFSMLAQQTCLVT